MADEVEFTEAEKVYSFARTHFIGELRARAIAEGIHGDPGQGSPTLDDYVEKLGTAIAKGNDILAPFHEEAEATRQRCREVFPKEHATIDKAVSALLIIAHGQA